MKTRLLIAGLALMATISYGQKREIKRAEKSIEIGEFTVALDQLKEAEAKLDATDNEMKAKVYANRGEALLGMGGNDHNTMLSAVEAYRTAISLYPKIKDEFSAQLHALRASLINGAVKDQNAQNYKDATEKLYASYQVLGDPSDLYFAAGNAVNGQDYKTALKYYQMLVDMDYSGVEEEFVATHKETGQVAPFENKNMRDIAVRSGEFIKPEVRRTESRKGEILRNMTLIYIDQGDNEKATTLMKQARAENPNDVYLMRAEADMSYKLGDIERYNELMNKIVATDPDNPEIYFNLGVGSAEIGENEKAIQYYTKALELNPDYEGALINIAVLKLSEESGLVEQMNSLGMSAADNRKYDELKGQLTNLYQESVPYLERAYKLNPKNPDILRTMMNIYGQLGEDAKFQEMKRKLDAMNSQGQ